MTKLTVIKDEFVDSDLCSPCGGKCCMGMPGSAMPEDFGETLEEIEVNVKEALRSGNWNVDWWEGDPRSNSFGGALPNAKYLRPATVDSVGLIENPSYGGVCVFHSSEGCTIFEKRPSGCKGLEPGEGSCIAKHSTKRDCATAWIPMRTHLEKWICELYEEE